MLSRNSISCFAFCKRAGICIKQHLGRNYFSCPAQVGVFVQQNHGINMKRFNFLTSRKCIQVIFQHNTTRYWNRAGCNGQRNIFQLRSLSSSETEKVASASASSDEHWGPYLVSRIHSLEESSRFHGYSTLRWGLSIVVTVLAGVYLFRDELRDNVADEVADVASRSMADENVMLKARDMTKGVLERLTNETDTIGLVSEFLKTVLQQNEVQNTAVAFATNILNHQQTQEKLQEVMKKTLYSILNNKDTKDIFLEFIKNLIEDPQTKQTCSLFLKSLTKDPDIQKMVSEFFKSILASPSFQMEAITLGREVTHKVVHDKDIQKQTGDALWTAIKYGITPYWFRGEK